MNVPTQETNTNENGENRSTTSASDSGEESSDKEPVQISHSDAEENLVVVKKEGDTVTDSEEAFGSSVAEDTVSIGEIGKTSNLSGQQNNALTVTGYIETSNDESHRELNEQRNDTSNVTENIENIETPNDENHRELGEQQIGTSNVTEIIETQNDENIETPNDEDIENYRENFNTPHYAERVKSRNQPTDIDEAKVLSKETGGNSNTSNVTENIETPNGENIENHREPSGQQNDTSTVAENIETPNDENIENYRENFNTPATHYAERVKSRNQPTDIDETKVLSKETGGNSSHQKGVEKNQKSNSDSDKTSKGGSRLSQEDNDLGKPNEGRYSSELHSEGPSSKPKDPKNTSGGAGSDNSTNSDDFINLMKSVSNEQQLAELLSKNKGIQELVKKLAQNQEVREDEARRQREPGFSKE